MTDLHDICGRPDCTLLRGEHGAKDQACPESEMGEGFVDADDNGVAHAVATFVLRHPYCCPRCGWHLSSHGHSHGLYSDCPNGRSPALADGTIAALVEHLTHRELSIMADRRGQAYAAQQKAAKAALGGAPDVLEAYRRVYTTDYTASDSRVFSAFSAGWDARATPAGDVDSELHARRISGVLADARHLLKYARQTKARIRDTSQPAGGYSWEPMTDDPAAPGVLAALDTIIESLQPYAWGGTATDHATEMARLAAPGSRR